MKTRTFMTRDVTCITPSDNLKQAYEMTCDQEIRHLLVVEGANQLVGLISERDILLRAVYVNGVINVPEIDVGLVMTTEIVTCKPSHQLHDVAEIMLQRRIDAIPVTDSSGEVLGIITSADFVEIAARKERDDLSDFNPLPFDFSVTRFDHPSNSSSKSRIRPQIYDANAQ